MSKQDRPIEMLEQPITQPNDFGSTESQAVDPLNNDSASVASHESADADVSEPIRETNTNPQYFDRLEDGHYQIRDQYLAGFTSAMEEFYRDLSSSYRHVSYSQIAFKTAAGMARFLSRLREMRPAVNKGLADDGPLVYLDFSENTAAIWESRWPSSDLKDALGDMRIFSTVTVFHQFEMKFVSDQERRHFVADCEAGGVKFWRAKHLLPKFELKSSTPLNPETVEGIHRDEVYGDWIAIRKHDGFEFELGPFSDRGRAVEAIGQFEYLISLIGAQE